MPRPPPLTLVDIPQVDRNQPLSQMYDWAGLLGLASLPDEAAREMALAIALAREALARVLGLTLRRQADQLKRFGKALRRERPGHPEIKVRQLLATPNFGWDVEIYERLAPLAGAPTAVLAAEVESCRRHLIGMREVDPQFRALVSAGGVATTFFLTYAADDISNKPDAWWKFVLAFLDTADFKTEALREHPERLRPLLDAIRVQLLGDKLLQRARAGER
jgi:hypothetical protein